MSKKIIGFIFANQFRFSLIILLFGIVLYGTRNQDLIFSDWKWKTSKHLKMETYWEQTKINDDELVKLLQPINCNSSRKYFLSCANAIIAVADRLNLSLELNESGKLKLLERPNGYHAENEKIVIEKWSEVFLGNRNQLNKISFNKIWNTLKQKYIKQEEQALLIGKAYNGFLSIYKDPHTYILPVDLYQDVIANLKQSTSRLGVILSTSSSNTAGSNKVIIKKIFKNSNAEKSGLLLGDQILKVNNRSVKNMNYLTLLDVLSGEDGAELDLVVLRGGEKRTISVHLQETLINSASSEVKIIRDRKIGIITLSKFAKNSCEQVRKSVLSNLKSNVEGMLLDLRDNPGGQMDEAACIASLFVGKKLIFELKYIDITKSSEQYFGVDNAIYKGPIAVLINSGSASAAEIVAGVIQTYQRGPLVGERTFGKGTFQEGEIWKLNKQVALFSTKGFYYLPNGLSPQQIGVSPDIKVKSYFNIISKREADIYYSPLTAPVQNSLVAKNMNALRTNNCLASSLGGPIDSIKRNSSTQNYEGELDQAESYLMCSIDSET